MYVCHNVSIYFFVYWGAPNDKHQMRVAVGLRFYALEYLTFIDGLRVSRPVKTNPWSTVRRFIVPTMRSSQRICVPIVNRAYDRVRRRDPRERYATYNSWCTHAYITIVRLSHCRVFHLLSFFFSFLFFQRVNGFYAVGSLNRRRHRRVILDR